jgi:HPt (histidine-containing phosphotransfer) domain-containing protein
MTIRANHQATRYVTTADLVEAFEGDAAFVRELMLDFLDRCPIVLEQLRGEIDAGDAMAISATAHSFKGTISYFDVGEGLEATQRLERITATDLPRAPAMFLQLERCIGELTRYLDREAGHAR